MRTNRFYTVLIVILLAMAVPASNMCMAAGQAASEEVTLTRVVKVHSAKMGRDILNTVVVPEQYYDPDFQEEQFPVMYLLHGYDGDYRNWSDKASLEALASTYSMIIVCPDGQDSWYVDSPVDPKMQFETYVADELVTFVDDHYRTIPDPKLRAITGLSMGGHGALSLALRHPDVFGSCGSMSGCVDITQCADKWKIAKRLGDYAQNKAEWESHSVLLMVPTLSTTQNIIIDDGTGDVFYEMNLQLHKALLERKIAHDFTIRPGAHTWDYWVNSLDYHALFFSKCFDKAFDD